MVQGRVLLLGDAAFIPRPHTAASTAKAGANALALGRALQEFPDDMDAALKEWEADQLALGRDLQRSGRALGKPLSILAIPNLHFMKTMNIEIYSGLICPWCYVD
jgi:2-polyprenyl-6-methoxyphenol hydroxylase-like FAD-dependent oxidoreductase